MWNDCHALGVDFGAWHMDSGTYDALENAYYGDEGSKHVLERRIPILLSWISATASRLLYVQNFDEESDPHIDKILGLQVSACGIW